MYRPGFSDFLSLVSQGNLIPVYRELDGDLETPVSVFLKLRSPGGAFLLESVERGEQAARYSFLGSAPAFRFTLTGDKVTLHHHAAVRSFNLDDYDPLDALRQWLAPYQGVRVPGLPRFTGGAVGYVAYDMVRHIERLPDTAKDELGLPDAMLLLADTLVAFDHIKHRTLLIANAHVQSDPQAAYQDAIDRIEDLARRLEQPIPATDPAVRKPYRRLVSNRLPEQYEEQVRRAQEYIAAGDIFQVVLSQRFCGETSADSFDIYRALRSLNPSPYMFFIDFGEMQLIGSSPEVLVRLEDSIAQLNPIAGTRPRGSDDLSDTRLAQELQQDPKECAEHVMLVDLGRNDLGRVCEFGTVHVPQFKSVDKYSHVMHLVSRVEGKLRDQKDAFDLLRATFPAGTVSGAPKVRAMEIIEELEGMRRGPYAGGVGYFGFPVNGTGNMDLCITIRTIIKQGTRVYVQAGAGIVADSDPAREHQECVNKATALAEAIRIAEER